MEKAAWARSTVARDVALGRDVAIKVLPSAFSKDDERLARFAREARVLASLNHPNIATVHALERTSDGHALVMELVEGETLSSRIGRGPLRIKDAVSIAGAIVEALDAAHERGIVHRDLKPANIMVTAQGAVKVLDFGLAKPGSTDELPDAAQSPTILDAATRTGIILGTAAYMSPEQARGQTVDKRTDIWSFGCVLYEMLAGRAAFAGPTVTDTLVKVLDREPDWTQLPTDLPAGIQALLRRCLTKDLKHRLRDIGDARPMIDAVGESGAVGAVPTVQRSRLLAPLGWVAAALLALALGAVLWLRPGMTPPAASAPDHAHAHRPATGPQAHRSRSRVPHCPFARWVGHRIRLRVRGALAALHPRASQSRTQADTRYDGRSATLLLPGWAIGGVLRQWSPAEGVGCWWKPHPHLRRSDAQRWRQLGR